MTKPYFCNMKNITAHVLITFCLLICGCGGEETKPQGSKIFNPNGDSELALLMREMHDDGMLTKQQILNGETPEVKCDYKTMYSIEATEPEKAGSTEYQIFGKAYEASVAALLAAEEEHRPTAYQTMVGACMNCHQAMCPGPMVKIKKMHLTEEQIASLED
jgi:hypothetical protein